MAQTVVAGPEGGPYVYTSVPDDWLAMVTTGPVARPDTPDWTMEAAAWLSALDPELIEKAALSAASFDQGGTQAIITTIIAWMTGE